MKLSINNNVINVKEMSNFKDKLIGNMFKKNINNLLFKTNSIHTFFCNNMDIIMLNKDFKIIYIKENLKPNKIIIKKNCKYVIELPSNTITKLNINYKTKITKIS